MTLILIIISILVFTISIYIFLKIYCKQPIMYFRFNSDGSNSKSIKLMSTFQLIFQKKYIFESNNSHQASIFFLDKLSDQKCFDIIKTIPNYQNKFIYTSVSIDYIASKSKLFEMYISSTNINKIKIFPESYIIANNKNIHKNIEKMFYENKLVILKNNVQQQKGCLIISKMNDLKQIDLSNYCICQELLQNPYTISGKKINLRVYVLMQITSGNEMNIFMYNDGFMYYTKENFIENSASFDSNITSGLLDRSIYKNRPLTIKDFKKFIGESNSSILSRNLKRLFKFLFANIKQEILKIEKTFSINKFILLGADIAVDKNFDLLLMEINKGPDMTFKDNRDKNLKLKLVNNMIDKVIFNKNDNNEFIGIPLS